MRWSDIDADGVWTVNVADADRMKGTIERVRLPPLALDTLRGAAEDRGLATTSSPASPPRWSTSSHNKGRLHKAMAAAMLAEHGVTMERWTLHDLRRSFRTRLGERCKVDPLTAELVHRAPHQGGRWHL